MPDATLGFWTVCVSLSQNGRPADRSTMSPKRKPSRMPCFTHVFTRHPEGVERSGCADRTVPASSAAFSSPNAARAAALLAPAPAATNDSMFSWSVIT